VGFNKFSSKYPTLFKQLVYWAYSTPKRHSSRESAIEEVTTYLYELVLSRNNNYWEAEPYLKLWQPRLTDRERRELWKVVPYNFPEEEKLDLEKFRLREDWYNSGYSVLTEEILEGFNYKGKGTGIITINSYQAYVLNADEMLIVDVDTKPDPRLLEVDVVKDRQAIAALKVWQEMNGGSFRVYRTAGGLRYIETTRAWNPSGQDTRRLMFNLYADPKYRILCTQQQTFRARLTPKPWRYDDWEYYLEGGENEPCRVCELLGTVGEKGAIDDRFKNLLKEHDTWTKATTRKELTLV